MKIEKLVASGDGIQELSSGMGAGNLELECRWFGMPVEDEALPFGVILVIFYECAKQWYLSRCGSRTVCLRPNTCKAVYGCQRDHSHHSYSDGSHNQE